MKSRIGVLLVASALVGCAGSASDEPLEANERVVSASDYGDRWPLTVDHVVLRCEGRESVTFTAPDGKTFELTPGLDVEDAELRAIWKPVGHATKISISPLIDAGLAICEEVRCGAFVSSDSRPTGHLVFTSTEAGRDLYAVNVDGTNKTRVAVGPSYEVEWSPDGSKIAFERAGHLVVAERGGGAEKVLAADVVDFEWSPDSGSLAVASDAVYVMSPDGAKRERAPTERTSDRTGWRDPDRLAWASKRVILIGSGGAVYASDLVSGATHQVAPRRVSGVLAWALSPAGRLAFATDEPQLDINLIDLDGSNFVHLVDNVRGHVSELAWSSDGRYLAVEQGIELAVIEPGKGQVNHVGPQLEPRWANDRWLGVVDYRGRRGWLLPDSEWRKQIHVLAWNGCGKSQVTDEAPLIPPDYDGGPPWDFAWDPRGERVP
jgi:dipeptidyl aminopeptidase/acylaminoacyl peptidase